MKAIRFAGVRALASFAWVPALALILGAAPTRAAAADDAPQGEVTFAKDVAPIFFAKCAECHRPGDIGPMSLLSYEEARPWAKSIKKAVSARTMPPFHAEKGHFEYANDVSLTDAELAAVVKWVDTGAKQGNAADLPPAPKFENTGWRMGKPDLELFPSADYSVGKEVNDEYRCYVLPSGLAEDTWVSAIEYRPGNRQVVHHIMAYAEPTGKARVKDDATPEPGFVCGMSGDQSTLRFDLLLGGWAPGTPPNVFPEGTGRLIPKNTDIVFQVHYHNTTGADQLDRSGMAFQFARGPIRAQNRIGIVGQFRLNIPAGEANATHAGAWTAGHDINLYSVMPHMHYLGKAMTVTATYPDGKKETLLDVQRYDFNWQIVYAFKEPLKIPKGTKFEMTSVHDNSAENPANPSKPPKLVTWGEATDQEMAHAWLGYDKIDENLNINPQPPLPGGGGQ